MNENQMWAVQYRSYGGPEVLGVGSVPRPTPGPRDVLVKVAGSSVNATDLLARQGKMRGINGLGFPKGIGVDFSGTVVEVGRRVSARAVGDRVWGYLGMKPPGRHAAAAQYLTIRADRIAVAPTNVPLHEAAALPLAGLTALQSLRALRVTTGSRVLVIGGSGGVGSTAIQVASALGATVDAVSGARTDTAALAGAQRVYDYHCTSPDQITSRYDAILDTATADLRAYRRLLKPRGRIAALTPGAIPAILASVFTAGPRIRFVSAKPKAADLAWLSQHAEVGALVPIIDAVYLVAQIADAHRDAEALPAGGKRVIASDLG